MNQFSIQCEALPSNPGFAKVKSKDQKTYIIVGAGFAGMSAALEILHLDPNAKIKIIEASDVPGGRVRSIRDKFSIPLDKCAMWIHGYQGRNFFKKLVTHFNVPHFLDPSSEKTKYYVTDSKDYTKGLSAEDAEAVVDRFYEYIYDDPNAQKVLQECIEDHKNGKYVSFGDFLNKLKLPKEEANQKIFQQFIAYLEHSVEGAQAKDLSIFSTFEAPYDFPQVPHYHFYPDSLGDEYIVKGADEVATKFAQLLESKNVEFVYNHWVKKIEHDKNTATIHCSNGKSFKGDYCIMTASAGVLKKGHIKFSPDLPDSHKKALAKIDMGAFVKIALEFEKPINSSDIGEFTAMDHLEEKKILSGEGFLYFVNFYPGTGKPIMMAIANGDLGKKIEKNIREKGYALASEGAKNLALRSLKKMFGEENIPAVKECFVTQPGNLKRFEGAWSYLTPGGTDFDRFTLGKPMGRLVLAGEHTNGYNVQNDVNAAVQAGIRAATNTVYLSHQNQNLQHKDFFVLHHIESYYLKYELNYKVGETQGSFKAFNPYLQEGESVVYTYKHDIVYNDCALITRKISGDISFKIDVKNESLTLLNGDQGQIFYKTDYYEGIDGPTKENPICGQWMSDPYLLSNKNGDHVSVMTMLIFKRDGEFEIQDTIAKATSVDLLGRK